MTQEDAKRFAANAHKGQKHMDDPYTKHLADVVRVLGEFNIQGDLLIAAWLHDTLEDTETSMEDLRSKFGPKVAEVVFCVTDEPGKNRQERHTKTYPKIAKSLEAITLKLADRIANVRNCWDSRDHRLFMYKKEHKGFRKALRAVPGSAATVSMWKELDNLLGWLEPPK